MAVVQVGNLVMMVIMVLIMLVILVVIFVIILVVIEVEIETAPDALKMEFLCSFKRLVSKTSYPQNSLSFKHIFVT